ncbi:LapA family protein [Methylomarinum sp. Ch1-1]|uniref:LapA family protein n=1 Tax=Methylomarinum roseum TaxID=3067653 RepID=A0AAU7NRY7_9GAMM|nr:LapA family protein [Methylomarinum sp. Ch1-1]MDP4520281.1 LapA family protein [Methylomarinum sp. Ch1-1]
MRLLALIVFFAVFIIALIFSILNFQSVEIDLYFITISLPLTVALTIELFAGIAIGFLAALLHIVKLKAQYVQLSKKIDKNNLK